MKVVLDIETIQASKEEWARLLGKNLSTGDPASSSEDLDLFSAGAAAIAFLMAQR